MKPKLYISRGLKKQKIGKYSFPPHFAYYWKMNFYCKWSIFSYLVTFCLFAINYSHTLANHFIQLTKIKCCHLFEIASCMREYHKNVLLILAI